MESQVHRGGVRSSALLRIHLLGRFEVVRADAPIPAQAWRRRRPADLLKLVGLARDRRLPRDAAIEALWPDKDPASGANNLHRALYDLRQVLGGRWVDIERGQLVLRSDAWLDVDAFEAAVTAGGPEDVAYAVSLYRGDLSPEDRESPWLLARRAVLRRRFAQAAFPLARTAAASGDVAAAVPLLRRVLEIDVGNEEAHRLLIRLLAEGGRRADALRLYDACEASLRAAGLGGPGDETRALRDAVQRGEVGPAQGRPPLDGARRAARRLLGTTEPPRLRGRGPALLLFEALLEQGSGALVLLGEAGVGKTRLAAEGARLALARGAAVLHGVPGATHAGAPYGLFADVFAEEARATGRTDLLAEMLAHDGGPRQERRRALFEAVRDGLAAAAEGRPLYVLLDELHAADESSLNLVHYLARQARELRLFLVATCREEEVRAGTPIQMTLAHLDFERLARGVHLPRLGLAATREQAADLLGAPPSDALVRQVYRVTDGLPFATEEVVRACGDGGQPAAVPADAVSAVRARVARLGPGAESLLAAAAVAGTRFDFEVVRAVSGLGGHDAVAALDDCTAARILDEDGGGHHFHHPLTREAVLAGLPPPRAAELHGAIADAIEERAASTGGDALSESLAWHRLAAGQPERALRHLVAAGHRAAAQTGLGEALGFYRTALGVAEQIGAPGDERLEIVDATARVQLALGELENAQRSFSLAASFHDGDFRPAPDERARSRRLGALALVAGGRLRDADAQINAAMSEGAAGSGDEVPALLHLRAQIRWHQGRDRETVEAAEGCGAAAQLAGDADLLARSRDLAALARASLGEPLAPVDDRTDAAERRRQDPAPEHPIDVHLVLWERDLLAGRPRQELERAAAFLAERARQRGAEDTLASSLYAQGAFALAAGRLDAANAVLREALARHRAAGSALGEALSLERLGTLLGMSGRFDAGMEALGEGVVAAERAPLRCHALTRLHAAEARNRFAAGALNAAGEALREASEIAARHGSCLVCDAIFRPEAVRIALARGRLDLADAEAAQLDAIAASGGGAGVAALARAARARVLAATGAPGEALAALAQARAALAAAGLDYEAGRAARLEVRLRGPAALADPAVAALDALVLVDADV